MIKKILLITLCVTLLTGCINKKKEITEVLDTTATIELEDGTIETIKHEDLVEMYQKNSVKYWKLYANQDISFIGTIDSMHTYSSYNGSAYGVDLIKFKEGWVLKLVSDSHDILQYDIGDKLSVQSVLGSCSSNCEVSAVGMNNPDGIWKFVDSTKLSIIE